MAYTLKSCCLSKDYLMDLLEGAGVIELEDGETIISISVEGENVMFYFDVKEE